MQVTREKLTAPKVRLSTLDDNLGEHTSPYLNSDQEKAPEVILTRHNNIGARTQARGARHANPSREIQARRPRHAKLATKRKLQFVIPKRSEESALRS